MAKTHWKKLTNPDYLGAYSLEDGQDVVLTIDHIKERERVTGTDGKTEELPVCYWREPGVKPMILNSTNMKMISKVVGSPYIQDWMGQKIQIGIEKVKAFGDVVDALRVRKNKPKVQAGEQPIACEMCGQVIRPAFNMSATEWAKYSKEKLGKAVCAECAQKIKDSEADK